MRMVTEKLGARGDCLPFEYEITALVLHIDKGVEEHVVRATQPLWVLEEVIKNEAGDTGP